MKATSSQVLFVISNGEKSTEEYSSETYTVKYEHVTKVVSKILCTCLQSQCTCQSYMELTVSMVKASRNHTDKYGHVQNGVVWIDPADSSDETDVQANVCIYGLSPDDTEECIGLME